VESPNLALDYVLYLGCLVLSAEITYVEYRFHIFDHWHHHLLMGLSRRLLKFSGGSVDDYAIFSDTFTNPSC